MCVVLQSVTLAKHRAPVSLAASVFSIGEIMLAVTGLILVRDPKEWIVSEPSSVIAIVYAVRFTNIHLLQMHLKRLLCSSHVRSFSVACFFFLNDEGSCL